MPTESSDEELQAELFRAVHAKVGLPCPAERWDETWAALPSYLDILPASDRVSIFGLSSLPGGLRYVEALENLARHLDVPGEIVEKPPTADLVEGQTDEGDFGISFAKAKKKFTSERDGEKFAMRRKNDEHFGRICRFFDTHARRCTIYTARPTACRKFPGEPRCGYWEFLKFERRHQSDPEFIAVTDSSPWK